MIAAGGFGANRPMLRAHAPSARGGLPLATPGDDGSGIQLGTGAGGATALLDRVSVWRFLSPPPALLRGVLVDRDGKRICDESRYGAAIGDAIVRRGGRAWLLVDRATLARGAAAGARVDALVPAAAGVVPADLRPGDGGYRAGVAARAGVDPDGLTATLAAYNAAAAANAVGRDPAATMPVTRPGGQATRPDAAAGQAAVLADRLLDQAPAATPAPVLTLGGLVVDQQTGHVLQAEGAPIAGLYAAGRSAVGLCSRSYVSGLSIADCVFSGRRAGHAPGSSRPAARPARGPRQPLGAQ